MRDVYALCSSRTRRKLSAVPVESDRLPEPLDHQEIAVGDVEAGVEGRELDRRASAIAVCVEQHGAGRWIVDDPIVGIGRRGAADELVRAEPARSEPGE